MTHGGVGKGVREGSRGREARNCWGGTLARGLAPAPDKLSGGGNQGGFEKGPKKEKGYNVKNC